MDKNIEQIRELIDKANYCVALTGAGISTLSGIPDFRSDETGLWQKFDPNKIFSLNNFYNNPSDFYEFAFENIYNFISKEPSIVHQVLASWEKEGKLKWTITQNIDLLHQKAGNKNVLELHGSPLKNYCINCKKNYTFEDILPSIEEKKIPTCSECNSVIKPDIIFFEEQLKEEVIKKSQEAVIKADLLLLLGSSMVVYPAAILPQMFLETGGKLIVVNRQPTQYDAFAEIKSDDLQKTFEALSK